MHSVASAFHVVNVVNCQSTSNYVQWTTLNYITEAGIKTTKSLDLLLAEKIGKII